MNKNQTNKIIRAWKDPIYLAQLDQTIKNHLPAHPIGIKPLSSVELEKVFGGRTETDTTYCVTIVPPCRKRVKTR